MANFVSGDWDLISHVQEMFGPQYLEECVGTNAIYLRSDSMEHYRRDFDATTRQAIQNFCLPLAERMVEAIDPEKIVVIGVETLDLFGRNMPDLLDRRGHRLTALGEIVGRPAIATKHLSGAWGISRSDRADIKDRVLTWVGNA